MSTVSRFNAKRLFEATRECTVIKYFFTRLRVLARIGSFKQSRIRYAVLTITLRPVMCCSSFGSVQDISGGSKIQRSLMHACNSILLYNIASEVIYPYI